VTLSVRYMGSKRSLAGRIASKISDRHPSAHVLDLFSGMCAVGTEVAPRHAVLTNDIHAFAEIVAHALFVAPVLPPTSLHARDELLAGFRRNAAALKSAVAPRLLAEAEALARCGEAGGWKKLFDLDQREAAIDLPAEIEGLPNLAKYRSAPKTFPYCLATKYFASGYFGILQSIEIDSLRYAIERGPDQHRAYYLAALLKSMSQCAAAPGHFAQFLVPRDRTNTRYIGKIRSRSVLERFYAALDSFPVINCHRRDQNKSFRSEATNLLNSTELSSLEGDLVIYADPPYSRAQYSRYYHVLETIIIYDYPQCTGKGRYREGRHLTGFSQKAAVESTFREFFRAASASGAPLYLSYPTNGLLNKAGVSPLEMMREFYEHAQIDEHIPINHSTMGASSGYASVKVFEDIYYASN
jgi:adenine-specific DNA-methyltransferase